MSQEQSSYLCYIIARVQEKSREIVITMDRNQEGLYIVLGVLSGLAFVLSIGLLMYIVHFLYTSIYKILVVEQRCSCRCGHPDSIADENGNQNRIENQYVAIEISSIPSTDLPPTYEQIEQKILPTYDEASTNPVIKVD
jgi:hypothetical protein